VRKWVLLFLVYSATGLYVFDLRASPKPIVHLPPLPQREVSPVVRLTGELLKNPHARTSLGNRVPAVAAKIMDLSDRYRDDGVTPAMLLGLIEVESTFNANAISHNEAGEKVAYGLMQVTQKTATPYLRDMGVSWSEAVALDPLRNLDVGAAHFASLHRRFKGNLLLASLGYNQGEGAVRAGYAVPGYEIKANQAIWRWARLGF